jgi:coenzyme Q-binding protein COQ10
MSTRPSSRIGRTLPSCPVELIRARINSSGPDPSTMPRYAEKRFLPYTPAQLFGLVAAVDRYPEFLPWCLAARVRSAGTLPGTPRKALLVADLVIGLHMMRVRYTSRVALQAPTRIDVTGIDGPFRHLNNHWVFEPVAASAAHPSGGTMVAFQIAFAFRSSLLQSLMGALFDDPVSRMVAAFEGRAKQLYGAGAVGAAARSPHLRRRRPTPEEVRTASAPRP